MGKAASYMLAVFVISTNTRFSHPKRVDRRKPFCGRLAFVLP
jgi:hypothetical protein